MMKNKVRARNKILFIDLGTSYGGVEKYLEGLVSLLGGEAELFALSSVEKLTMRLKEKNVSVTDISYLRSKWMKPIRCLVAMFVAPWLVYSKRIDSVQINGFFESYLLPLLCLLRVRTVYTMHGPLELDMYRWYRNPERFFPRLLSRHSLRFSSTVVCVSEAVGEIAKGVLADTKITVIPNWVDRRVLPKREYAVSQPMRLLCVGRVEQYKGLQLVLEALRLVPGLTLSIVGSGGYLEDLRSLAAGLPVDICGFIDDPSPLYASADIFINPSLGPEGLPMVSLEAMSYGLPCILSDLPVHREISLDGKAAVLFESGSSASLGAKLEQLSGDVTALRSYGWAARMLVEERYSLEAVRERYGRVLLN